MRETEEIYTSIPSFDDLKPPGRAVGLVKESGAACVPLPPVR